MMPRIWSELIIVLTCPCRWGSQNDQDDDHLQYRGKSKWKDRKTRWKTHIEAVVYLKHHAPPGNAFQADDSAYYSEQLDYLGNHLAILDTKVSMLLTFLGLISITSFLSSVQSGRTHDPWLSPLTIILYVTWIIATLLCLWAVWQVMWGELNRERPTSVSEDIFGLIKTIIERTAKYRVAVSLTFVAVLSAAVFMARLWWHPPTVESGTKLTLPQSAAAQFADNTLVGDAFGRAAYPLLQR
jgi:hypothetical protein